MNTILIDKEIKKKLWCINKEYFAKLKWIKEWVIAKLILSRGKIAKFSH